MQWDPLFVQLARYVNIRVPGCGSGNRDSDGVRIRGIQQMIEMIVRDRELWGGGGGVLVFGQLCSGMWWRGYNGAFSGQFSEPTGLGFRLVDF